MNSTMIKFKHNDVEKNVDHDEINEQLYEIESLHFSGELFYENYPVNLHDISNKSIEDTLIQSFKPFLQLKEPLIENPNFYTFDIRETRIANVLHFAIYFPNLSEDLTDLVMGKEVLYISINYSKDSKSVLLKYDYWEVISETNLEGEREGETHLKGQNRIREARPREDKEDQDFLQNVLNAMVRFLNTSIKEYSMMSSSVLRKNTGKFLGRAETLVAQCIGADPSIVKDGFAASSQTLKEQMQDPRYFRNL